MESSGEMQSYAERLHTFQIPHQLSKRRASSQNGKKKGANTVEWPHSRPLPEDLASAGFFYKPSPDSNDNVQCFFCQVRLDGWEESDDALTEHLVHRQNCQWAQCKRAGALARANAENASADSSGDVDPMGEEAIAARRATYEIGTPWPHEGKRGWKCKVAKMLEAGWCFDPAPKAAGAEEEQDGVTCFHCDLSLDGWEPKDDPAAEHKNRMPDCPFFALKEKFKSSNAKKGGKGKGKGKGRNSRTSAASTSSRLSTQSLLSTTSDLPGLSEVDVNEDPATEMDDPTPSTIVNTETTDTGKSKAKKGGRPKAAGKGARGRKRAGTVDSEAEPEPFYPDLSQSQQLSESSASQPILLDDATPKELEHFPDNTRSSKAAKSSASRQGSSNKAPQRQKTTRGRKAKADPELESREESLDQSEVSAQLQEELDRSMSTDLDARFDLEEQTPTQTQEPSFAKTGIKRMSNGAPKERDDYESGKIDTLIVEFPLPATKKTARAGKNTKKGSQQSQVSSTDDSEMDNRISQVSIASYRIPEPEQEQPQQAKSKKPAHAAKKGKGKKSSSAQSSRSSKATVRSSEPEVPQQKEDLEDLDRDEREIEAELIRIAAEQAARESKQVMELENDKLDEFEPSPSSYEKRPKQVAVVEERVEKIQALEHELQREVDQIPNPGKNLATFVETVARPSVSQIQPQTNGTTPSPAGSDKENLPSSAFQQDVQSKVLPPASPSKITRIPLANSTPNQQPLSPSKRLSPSKQLSHLRSALPWEAIDLDTVLLGSPEPTPGTLARRLAGAAGVLTSPEKGLTVEQWVRSQAEKSEQNLRRRCEEMVGRFEMEGNRALASLNGIATL